MKITKSYLKQLIKEELQEFKGAKPIETMQLIFTYKLEGELRTFSDFDFEAARLPYDRELSKERLFNHKVQYFIKVEGSAPVSPQQRYDAFRGSQLFTQIPDLADKNVESSHGSRPLSYFKFDTLLLKYKEKDDRYHGYLPVSLQIVGGRFDGYSTNWVNITPKKPGPSDHAMVPKKDREQHDDSMWREKTQAEKDAEIAAGKRKPS